MFPILELEGGRKDGANHSERRTYLRDELEGTRQQRPERSERDLEKPKSEQPHQAYDERILNLAYKPLF